MGVSVLQSLDQNILEYLYNLLCLKSLVIENIFLPVESSYLLS